MTYRLKINLPGTHNGDELSIPGLGTYKNGSTYTVSAAEADAFRTYQRDNGMPDQTLLQAFKGNAHVTVETTQQEDPKPGPTSQTGTPPGQVSKTDTDKGSENSATAANKKDGDK